VLGGVVTASAIIWSNPIPKNIVEMGVKLDTALRALMQYESTRSEAYMRNNAPWKDQTGNARNGLFAKPLEDTIDKGVRYGIVLFHTMPYGIFLETRWSGRYAIIVPTVEVKGPDLMKGADKILSRLGLGA
jgi:hypothetical protein